MADEPEDNDVDIVDALRDEAEFMGDFISGLMLDAANYIEELRSQVLFLSEKDSKDAPNAANPTGGTPDEKDQTGGQ